VPALDLGRLKVLPLESRRSLSQVADVLIDPDAAPPEVSARVIEAVTRAVADVQAARARGAAVILMYGAHLLRNGAARLVTRLMEEGWVTHLATNGAGTIHDWEFAWLGRSTEGVEENVAAGTFGCWDETGRWIHMALAAGALSGLGYGAALGEFICADGCDLPDPNSLADLVAQFPADPMASAACDLLAMMQRHGISAGRHAVVHRWKEASILAQARRIGVPVTVHPGIGYDIIACHPMFHGAVIGRAAATDFREFAGAVEQLDGGVVLSVGSAIMAPQVFEKSLSCVHNLRFQAGRPAVNGHRIHVVDLQEGGGWDWTAGEPPKSNPAYYLRFCKSFSRMGGEMRYVQADNAAFIHHLWRGLGTRNRLE
jgi:hypothetical protein